MHGRRNRAALLWIAATTLAATLAFSAVAATDKGPAEQAAHAISTLSDVDWSISDGDELLRRVISQSSKDGLEQLAAHGDAKAETLVGIGLFSGFSGFPEDEKAADELFRKAVEQNFAGAEVMLGVSHVGRSQEDDEMAVELFRKAANQGDAGGEICLGDMYREGLGGLVEDRAKAIELYRKSADQGDQLAIDRLHSLGIS